MGRNRSRKRGGQMHRFGSGSLEAGGGLVAPWWTDSVGPSSRFRAGSGTDFVGPFNRISAGSGTDSVGPSSRIRAGSGGAPWPSRP